MNVAHTELGKYMDGKSSIRGLLHADRNIFTFDEQSSAGPCASIKRTHSILLCDEI